LKNGADGPVEVSIIDKGPGIPAEHVPRLTERFYRVSIEDSRSKKGTGLGLAIVKKIIEEHGGQLELHDAPADFDRGRGAMIRVHLPRWDPTPASPAANDKESVYGL
ncbi:ATP-binding protein, partial [Rhizobium phaseoli]